MGELGSSADGAGGDDVESVAVGGSEKDVAADKDAVKNVAGGGKGGADGSWEPR